MLHNIHTYRIPFQLALLLVATTTMCLGCQARSTEPPAAPLGANATGEQLFKRHCWICHQPHTTPQHGAAPHLGPTLKGLVDSKAGSVEGYAYSAALTNSNVVWNRDNLTKLLEDPQRIVPGIKMQKVHLDRDSIRRLVDYMETL